MDPGGSLLCPGIHRRLVVVVLLRRADRALDDSHSKRQYILGVGLEESAK